MGAERRKQVLAVARRIGVWHRDGTQTSIMESKYAWLHMHANYATNAQSEA